jgi:hypothetical protein
MTDGAFNLGRFVDAWRKVVSPIALGHTVRPVGTVLRQPNCFVQIRGAQALVLHVNNRYVSPVQDLAVDQIQWIRTHTIQLGS